MASVLSPVNEEVEVLGTTQNLADAMVQFLIKYELRRRKLSL